MKNILYKSMIVAELPTNLEFIYGAHIHIIMATALL